MADAFIDEGVKSGKFLVHDGDDVGVGKERDAEFWGSLSAKRESVKRVIFLLDITKVGDYACW